VEGLSGFRAGVWKFLLAMPCWIHLDVLHVAQDFLLFDRSGGVYPLFQFGSVVKCLDP